MKNYHFSIVIEHDKNGYFAFCPELQGCYAQGGTHEEVMKNIKDAIKLHTEDILADKRELPKMDSISLSMVEVAV